MGASLDAPGTAVTPSSYGQPLNPVTLPGTLVVTPQQVTQFLRGFPIPPGAPDVVGGIEALLQQGAQAFNAAAVSGDIQGVIQQVVIGAVKAAPAIASGIGGLVSLSGIAAGIAGPIAAGLGGPYGAAVAGALEVYAPLAAVGGQGVAGLGTAAQLAAQGAQQVAAQMAQAQAAAAAAGG